MGRRGYREDDCDDVDVGIRIANDPYAASADDFDFVAERDLLWRRAWALLINRLRSLRLSRSAPY